MPLQTEAKRGSPGREGSSVAEKLTARISYAAGGCWEWTGAVNTTGYGVVMLRDAFRRTSTTAHRIAYQEWVGPIPKGHFVLHRCDNRLCIDRKSTRLNSSH